MKIKTGVLLFIGLFSAVRCCWPWDPCPALKNPPVVCKINAHRDCEEDSDCLFLQKCCRTECQGTKCIQPVVPGCPNVPETKLCLNRFRTVLGCSANDPCMHKGENCCPGPYPCNILHCVVPTKKPGKCVKWPQAFCLCQDPFLCGDDSDCEGSKKCCSNQCSGTTCQDVACYSKNGATCQCKPKAECKDNWRKCRKGRRKCKGMPGYVCCCPKNNFPDKCQKRIG